MLTAVCHLGLLSVGFTLPVLVAVHVPVLVVVHVTRSQIDLKVRLQSCAGDS